MNDDAFGMEALYFRCPELAVKETRTLFLPPGGIIPPGEYGYLEHYCVDPKCDCRRVVLRVAESASPHLPIATINYGWESPAFYERWATRIPSEEAKEFAAEITGASLDPINPQSPFADFFLKRFQDMIANEEGFKERFASHYEAFRKVGRQSRRGEKRRRRKQR